MCQDLKKIWDPGSPGSRIRDLGSFSFSLGILEIFDPVTTTLWWDPGDLGSRIEKILLDPGDPGSSLGKLSWDLADLRSCTTICHCHLVEPLHPMQFCFWFPMSMRCLSLSTVKMFNHILIQPFCFALKATSPCWFLHMFSIIGMLLTGSGRKEKNAHFITS